MAVERSSCHLEIPPDVAAILASVDAQDSCYPVWTFSKHNSGYSLKLFWKSEPLKRLPNNAHSVSATSHRKKRSKQRMEAFLAKKRAVVPATTSKQSASESVSGVKVGSPICTPNSYADVLSAPRNRTSTSGLDADTQVPSNTCSPSPSPRSPVGDESPVKLSPVANHTRSKSSSQCNEPRIDFKQQVVSDESTVKLSPVASRTRSKESSHLVLKLPDSLTGITKHHEDFVRCEEADVADTVKGLMQQQWTSLVTPGQKVKVKIKDKLVSAVIENCLKAVL